MTPETLSTLRNTFDRLDLLLPDARSFSLTEEGITFSAGRETGCCGEYQTEWQTVSLTWTEFLESSEAQLDQIVKIRWDEAYAESEAQARAVKVAEEKRARKARERKYRLARVRKEAAERAKLAELLAKYGSP